MSYTGNFGVGTEQGSVDKSGTRTGEQTTELEFDEATKAYLDKILASTMYSKEAAISDSAAASKLAQQRSLEMGLPGVSGAAKSAGGYSSTTQEMLTNDVAARSEAAGSQVMLDTIAKYAQVQAGQVQAATGAVSATTGRKVSSTETFDEASHTGSTTRKAGLGFDTGAGTVICTQLYLDKHISLATYKADTKYVRTNFSQATQRGYRFWAVPLVRLMRRNSTAYAIGKYFGVRWSLHCAGQRNIIGWALITAAVPVCYCLGLVVSEVPCLRSTHVATSE